MKLSENFSLAEFITSDYAIRKSIDNTPADYLISNIKKTAHGLEIIRNIIGHPIHILSGFRSFDLNKRIGGSANSQHCSGKAADIISPKFGNAYLLAKIIEQNISYLKIDQLILEYDNWVHVSFTAIPRGQILTIHNPTEWYQTGIVTKKY